MSTHLGDIWRSVAGPPPPPAPYVRGLIPADYPDVMAIEESTRAAGGRSLPWPYSRVRQEGMDPTRAKLVAQIAGRGVGYLVAERYPWDAHVIRLAVHPKFRRRGVGRALVLGLIADLHLAEPGGRGRLTAAVAEDDQPALLFLKAMNFRTALGRRGVCPGGRDEVWGTWTTLRVDCGGGAR